jgi:hypothetical protein
LSRTLSFSGLFADAAACSRRLQSRQRAFADDIALELGLLQFSAKR